MNPNPPTNDTISELEGNGDTSERKVYEYKLSLLSNLLNPPEALVYRCMGVFLLLLSIWQVFQNPSDSGAWLTLIIAAGCSWYFVFRHGLPLYSRGKMVTLVITERIVAFEIDGAFNYVPKTQVTVRRGLAGTHIISRPAHGDCLLVNKDAVGFDELKSYMQK